LAVGKGHVGSGLDLMQHWNQGFFWGGGEKK